MRHGELATQAWDASSFAHLWTLQAHEPDLGAISAIGVGTVPMFGAVSDAIVVGFVSGAITVRPAGGVGVLFPAHHACTTVFTATQAYTSRDGAVAPFALKGVHESAVKSVVVVRREQCDALLSEQGGDAAAASSVRARDAVVVSVEARCLVCVSAWATGQVLRKVHMDVRGPTTLMSCAAVSPAADFAAVSLGLSGVAPHVGRLGSGVAPCDSGVVAKSPAQRRREKLLRRIGSHSPVLASSRSSVVSEAYTVDPSMMSMAEVTAGAAVGLTGWYVCSHVQQPALPLH